MARLRWMLVLLAAVSIRAAAQQEAAPSAQDGPTQIPIAKTDASQSAKPQTAMEEDPVPVPDKDGVYELAPGVELPRLIDAATVAYPSDVPRGNGPRSCIVSLVVGSDGVAADVKVIRSLNPPVDKIVLDAMKKAHFEPGTVSGKPAPVRIDVSLHFFGREDTATLKVLQLKYSGPMIAPKPYDVSPKLIHSVEAESSDEARREGKSGVVVISLVVSEDGMPTQVHVVRGAGMGLDEQAVAAVNQYRFKPAMKDGQPVAAQISVMVSFKFYNRRD
jgi:TonB family protein